MGLSEASLRGTAICRPRPGAHPSGSPIRMPCSQRSPVRRHDRPGSRIPTTRRAFRSTTTTSSGAGLGRRPEPGPPARRAAECVRRTPSGRRPFRALCRDRARTRERSCGAPVAAPYGVRPTPPRPLAAHRADAHGCDRLADPQELTYLRDGPNELRRHQRADPGCGRSLAARTSTPDSPNRCRGPHRPRLAAVNVHLGKAGPRRRPSDPPARPPPRPEQSGPVLRPRQNHGSTARTARDDAGPWASRTEHTPSLTNILLLTAFGHRSLSIPHGGRP